MKFYLGLLLIGIASGACSQPSGDSHDLGAMDGSASRTTLNLIAGGLGGSGNADDAGPLARFSQPSAVATDGAGNLYLTDAGNHTIRKVVLATGVVSTIAGTAGLPGSADGTGTAARFNQPLGLAADGAGNLYLTDAGNHTLRKIVLATGAVSTIAGTVGMPGSADGTGTAARFNQPFGVAVDGAGNLYVADTFNFTVRKVVLATSIVSTIAGTAGMPGGNDGTGAAARLSFPKGVAVDGAGNLYVTDTLNHTVRKVVLATSVVSTLAGTAATLGSADGTGAAARFSFPNGVAVDGTGNLYVADANNSSVRKVVLATSAVSTIAGTAGMPGSADGTGSVARFSSPIGVTVDSTGNLYVADANNSTVRKVVLATSAVSTVAGTAAMLGSADGTGVAARFDRPNGVTADSAGNIYLADTGNHTIRKVVLATSAVSTLAGTAAMMGSADGTGAAAQFNTPYGVAVDGVGNLYVADTNNHTIRKVVLATSVVSTLAGTATLFGSADGAGAAARFNTPNGVAADGAGNLYVADTNNHTIRKMVLATSVVSTLAGTAGMPGSLDGTGATARFNAPSGVAADDAGNLYIADTTNSTIRKVVIATGVVSTIVGTAGMPGSTDGTNLAARLNFPRGVAADGAGNLYVADTTNSTLRKVVLATGGVSTLVGVAGQSGIHLGPLPARLNQPASVTVAPSGKLIICDSAESVLLEVP